MNRLRIIDSETCRVIGIRDLCFLLTKGASLLLLVVLLTPEPGFADSAQESHGVRKQLIPILATMFDHNHQPVGFVAELEVALGTRGDNHGMDVTFASRPGRFSRMAQLAVVAAITHTARVANLDTNSWTVSLTVPYEGVTVYGVSLSAMIGLTVVALARGDSVKPYRVVTGTVRPDGHIGAVSGIALKLEAAQVQHLRRVLVPEDYDVTDGDWKTPFLLHVSPVGTVFKAYRALTDQTLQKRENTGSG